MLFLRRKPRIDHPKVVMTLLVRDEVDVMDLFIRHHACTGIDALIVTDHGSSDGTREIIEQHRRDGLVTEVISEPAGPHDQARFVHRMIQRAATFYGADFCVHSDADEFWFLGSGSFRKELARNQTSKITCASHHMLPAPGEPFWKATDRCTKVDDPARFGIPPYYNLFGDPRDMSKIIHRTQGYEMIGSGNHGVTMSDTIKERSRTIRIYHYSLRSVAQFKRKILEHGAALEANRDVPENLGTHWRYLYRRAVAGQVDLEEEFYKITAAGQIESLRKAGGVVYDAAMKSILAPLTTHENANSIPSELQPAGATLLDGQDL